MLFRSHPVISALIVMFSAQKSVRREGFPEVDVAMLPNTRLLIFMAQA